MDAATPYDRELDELRWLFALKLKPLRRERFRSQEGFAEHARLHRTTIGGLEQGKTDPRLSTLLIVADALNVPVEQLIKGLPVPKERKPPRETQTKGSKLAS